jgi:hypothetical protein
MVTRKQRADNRADARCCHEPSHSSIVACQPHHLAVEVGNLLLDSLTCLEQRLDHSAKFWPIVDQLRRTYCKHVHLCPSDDEPEVLEKSADLVFEIPFGLDEQRPADEKSLDSVTVEIFDAHLLVPATLHDTRDADSVVAVALVDLHLQCCLRVPGIDADHGQPILLSSVHSHVDVAPVSSPIRATCGACALMNAAIASGLDATAPSRTIFPVPSTMQIAVSFSDTSSPTKCSLRPSVVGKAP